MSGRTEVAKARTMAERMDELQPAAPYIALVLLVMSVVFSALPGTTGYLFLWAATGLGGVLFLRVAYPRGFTYELWLLAIYLLSGFGAFLMVGLLLEGIRGIIVGLLLEVMAIYTIYQLIIEIKGIRDVSEGPRISLGLWTLGVILFYLASNGALAGLANWIKNGGDLYGYMLLEVVAILLVLFISARTEVLLMYFEEGPMAIRRRTEVSLEASTEKVIRSAKEVATRTRKAIVQTGKARAAGQSVGPCPLCNSLRRTVLRSCPNCGELERTAVCQGSGHVFIPCPSCGRANYHGDYRCKKCDAKLGEIMLCRKCGKEADLVDWRVAEEKGEEPTS